MINSANVSLQTMDEILMVRWQHSGQVQRIWEPDTAAFHHEATSVCRKGPGSESSIIAKGRFPTWKILKEGKRVIKSDWQRIAADPCLEVTHNISMIVRAVSG